jgi:transcriptional regulator with XRE-family HTH domain
LTVKADGDRLRQLRRDFNVRQHIVEDAGRLGRSRLTHYESGGRISFEHLTALAEYYGVDPMELVDRDNLAELFNYVSQLVALFGAQLVLNGQPWVLGDAVIADGHSIAAQQPALALG